MWNIDTGLCYKKLSQANSKISKLHYLVPEKTLLVIYFALFQSRLTYASQMWKFTSGTKLRNLQKKFLKLIAFWSNLSSYASLFKSFKILKLNELHMFQVLKFIFGFTNGIKPKVLSNMFQL